MENSLPHSTGPAVDAGLAKCHSATTALYVTFSFGLKGWIATHRAYLHHQLLIDGPQAASHQNSIVLWQSCCDKARQNSCLSAVMQLDEPLKIGRI